MYIAEAEDTMLKLTESFLYSVRSTLSLLSNVAVLGSKEPCQVPTFSKGMLNGKQERLLLVSICKYIKRLEAIRRIDIRV